jgi:hypothetical protein
MKWLIFFSLVVFSLGCSKESKHKLFTKASLKCEVKGQQLKTGSINNKAYKRGQAPAYIDSVKIKVHNNEYSVPDVEKTYVFIENAENDATADDIIIDGLTVGNNTITADGYNKYDPANTYHADIAAASGSTIDDKATAYAQALVNSHNVYAIYKENSPLEKIIYTDNTDNPATLSMVTQNHRVAVVVENTASSQYVLKASVAKEGSPVLESANFIEIGKQDAMVINDSNAEGTIDYAVKIVYYTKINHVAIDSVERIINATASNSITKLYSFKKGDLLTGNSSSTITWTPLTDSAEGEEIN